MSCPFCVDPNVKERIIIENELAFAFPTQTPIVPGHILITPKRHVQYYEEATQDEMIAIEELRAKIKFALIKTFDAKGFNYAWNEEEIGGQSVPHFHLHIVPRKENDNGIYGYEPRSFLYHPGSRSVTPDEELFEVMSLVKANI